MRPRITYANVVSTLALFVALGGTSIAVTRTATPSSAACAVPGGNCAYKHLNGRDFSKRELSRTRWMAASLRNASFLQTDLYGATFFRADLHGANLGYGNRTKADFREADLSGTNLTKADFWGSNLRKADLSGAHIQGARFDHTNLFFASFEGAQLDRGTGFDQARLCHTIQPNGTVRNDDCGKGGGSFSGSSVQTLPGDPSQKPKPSSGGSGNSGNSGSGNGSGTTCGGLRRRRT